MPPQDRIEFEDWRFLMDRKRDELRREAEAQESFQLAQDRLTGRTKSNFELFLEEDARAHPGGVQGIVNAVRNEAPTALAALGSGALKPILPSVKLSLEGLTSLLTGSWFD
jgi:hypothetical protein